MRLEAAVLAAASARKKNPKTGKRRNLGTFKSREKAVAHERAIQFFKRS